MPRRRAWYERPKDDRAGKSFCKKCGGEVTTVKVEGVWHTRNTDGLPHALTCGTE